jgi:hypothetical protein
MKMMALKQLQTASPGMYDPIAIDTASLKAIGWSNPEQFFAPQDAQQNPPPELIEKQARAKSDGIKAEATMLDAQTRAQASQMKAKVDMMKMQIDMLKAQTDADFTEQELHSKAQDRAAKERIQLVDLAQNLAVHPESAGLVDPLIQPAMQDISEQEQQQFAAPQMPPMPPEGGQQ